MMPHALHKTQWHFTQGTYAVTHSSTICLYSASLWLRLLSFFSALKGSNHREMYLLRKAVVKSPGLHSQRLFCMSLSKLTSVPQFSHLKLGNNISYLEGALCRLNEYIHVENLDMCNIMSVYCKCTINSSP